MILRKRATSGEADDQDRHRDDSVGTSGSRGRGPSGAPSGRDSTGMRTWGRASRGKTGRFHDNSGRRFVVAIAAPFAAP